MAADIRRLIPFLDPSVSEWAAEARWLRWLTFLWLFVGLTALFSASYPIANSEFGDGLYYFKRQLIAVAIGLAGLLPPALPVQNSSVGRDLAAGIVVADFSSGSGNHHQRGDSLDISGPSSDYSTFGVD